MYVLITGAYDLSMLLTKLMTLYHFLLKGLAKYVEWSANMMEEEAKRKLKSAELQCKKDKVKMWANYVPPATNSKALHDQNFTGKVETSLLV